MEQYDIFANFYDATMGDRTAVAELLRGWIRKFNPHAQSVLELACGTGEIMRLLSDDYEVSGLDLSCGMLKVARRKLPAANFYRESMAGFELPEKYDAVYCVFDSINHLLRFSDWKKTFKSASRHLNAGGVFIFDMNTEKKLEEIVTRQPAVYDCAGNTAIMDVSATGRGTVNWNVKVFERTGDGRYRLHEEDIREISFPLCKVKAALAPFFSRVAMVDRKRSIGDEGERVYFVCQK